MRFDQTINELAAGQHALVATWQLAAHGLRWRDRDRLADGVAWQHVTGRVLARCGVPWTDDRRLMAAVLDASPGAAVASRSGAAVWGVPGYRVEPVYLARHRGISRRRSPLAVVHEVVDLLPHHIKIVRGIPVVSPARVICELTAIEHPDRVARNLDWLWSRRLLDGRTFRRTVAELAGRGRKGSTVMRELDAARGPGYVPHDSGTELRFAQILERAGQRPMRRQVDLGSKEEWTGRVDFVDAELPLVVEVQSARHHASLVDRADDERRQAALHEGGITVVEAWDDEIWHRPDDVVARVAVARAALRRATTPRTRDGATPNVVRSRREFA